MDDEYLDLEPDVSGGGAAQEAHRQHIQEQADRHRQARHQTAASSHAATTAPAQSAQEESTEAKDAAPSPDKAAGSKPLSADQMLAEAAEIRRAKAAVSDDKSN
jgi:hypothetical protein